MVKKNFSFLCFDFFSYKPTIPFDGKKEHKSCFTIFLSYTHICFTVLAILVFGQELIVRENPSLIITEKRVPMEEPFELNFNSNEIPMSFGLFIHNGLIPWDKRYFTIFGEQRTLIREAKQAIFSMKKTIFEMGSCPLSYVAANIGENLTKEELNYFLTIPMCMENKISSSVFLTNSSFSDETKSPLFIKGFFGAKNYSILYVKYAKCVNSTDPAKPVCAPQEEIDNKVKQLYVGTKVLNKFLNPKSYKSPIKQNYEWVYAKPPLKNARQKVLRFQRNILRSNAGLLTDQEDVEEFFTLSSSQEEDVSPLLEEGDDDFFFAFCLLVDNTEKTFTRNYKKLQDVFAQVGGIMKVLMLLTNLLVKPFLERKFKLSFLESLLAKPVDGKKTQQRFQLKEIQTEIKKRYKKLETKFDIKNVIIHVNYMEKLLKIIFDDHQRKIFKTECLHNLTHAVRCKDTKDFSSRFEVKKSFSEMLDKRPFQVSLSNIADIADEEFKAEPVIKIFEFKKNKLREQFNQEESGFSKEEKMLAKQD